MPRLAKLSKSINYGYHVTFRKNLTSIFKNGLKPSSGITGSSNGDAVWLTSLKNAKKWYRGFKQKGSEVVYPISWHGSKARPERLAILKVKLRKGKHSIVDEPFMGNFAIQGTVHPKDISHYTKRSKKEW